MRAVVESPRMVELHGINADQVAHRSRGCCRACSPAWPGCCIAPLFAQLDPLDFFTLLVAAIAAACSAVSRASRWRSSAASSSASSRRMLAGYLPTDSVLATGLRPSLPFVVLFLLLLVLARRCAQTSATSADPLAGVDPPPPPPGRRPLRTPRG